MGRSPGEKAFPLQYSGLENSMDCIVDGVAKSRTQLFLTAYLKIFLCKQSQLIILTIFSQMDKNEKTKEDYCHNPQQKDFSALGTFLVAQWIIICLPRQGTWVQSLIREDSMRCGTTQPLHHNLGAYVLQLLSPSA